MELSRTSLVSRTFSRTHFELLGLEASSPRKLLCPSSRIAPFLEPLKSCWKTPDTSRKICEDLFLFCSSEDHLKKILEDLFCEKKNFEDIFFNGKHLRLCLRSKALPSRGFVPGLGLGIFLCFRPWPRTSFPRLHFTRSNLIQSIQNNF